MQVVYGSGSGGAVSKNSSSYPPVPRYAINSSWKKVPLAPVLTLSVVDDIVTGVGRAGDGNNAAQIRSRRRLRAFWISWRHRVGRRMEKDKVLQSWPVAHELYAIATFPCLTYELHSSFYQVTDTGKSLTIHSSPSELRDKDVRIRMCKNCLLVCKEKNIVFILMTMFNMFRTTAGIYRLMVTSAFYQDSLREFAITIMFLKIITWTIEQINRKYTKFFIIIFGRSDPFCFIKAAYTNSTIFHFVMIFMVFVGLYYSHKAIKQYFIRRNIVIRYLMKTNAVQDILQDIINIVIPREDLCNSHGNEINFMSYLPKTPCMHSTDKRLIGSSKRIVIILSLLCTNGYRFEFML
ncbi:hypothetical protein QTP88_019582 [Uroleucon formosanum]